MCADDHDQHGAAGKFDLATRRAILIALGAAAAGSVAAKAAAAATLLPGMRLAPTPGIDLIADSGAHELPKPLIATHADILGPFWRAGAPFLSNIVPEGAAGQKIVMSGRVLDTDGKPLSGVVMDFWNSDNEGLYDLKSPNQAISPEEFKFRGILLSGDDGRYEVQTIVPGKYRIPPKLIGFEKYAGIMRPSHVHLMTSHADCVPLVTQIYFQGDPEIPNDPWGSKSRNVVAIDKTSAVWRVNFDVVLLRYGGV